jgi:hypothetical protein
MAPTARIAAIESHPRYAPEGTLSPTELALLDALKGGPIPTDELMRTLGVMNVSAVARRLNAKLEAQESPTRVTCTLGAILNDRGRRIRVGFWSAGEV